MVQLADVSNALIYEQFLYIDKFTEILTLKDSEWSAKKGFPDLSIKPPFSEHILIVTH